MKNDAVAPDGLQLSPRRSGSLGSNPTKTAIE